MQDQLTSMANCLRVCAKLKYTCTSFVATFCVATSQCLAHGQWPGPKFMALLTVSKESVPTEARNSALTPSVCRRLAGVICLLVGMHTLCYYAFFAYTGSADIWCLNSKRRMMIVSSEFGSKQSNEIGPRWLVAT